MGTYSSVEMQFVYSTAPIDWEKAEWILLGIIFYKQEIKL